MSTPKLPRKTILRISASANVDERTCRGLQTGKKRTTPAIAEAIRIAARAMGIELPEVRP